MSAWIEGRPPADDGTYIVANARGNVCPMVRGIIANNPGTANDWHGLDAVMYWMPLPSPPGGLPANESAQCFSTEGDERR